MKQKGAYPVAMTGLYAALAIILGYVETLIPIQIGISGIKPGLANIVIVFVLYMAGGRYALFVSLIRIVVLNTMFGNFMMLVFSLAGGLCSLATMLLVKKIPGIRPVSVSVCGGVAHNVGQIIIAVLFVKNTIVLYYLPLLGIGGLISGILIGMAAGYLLKRFQPLMEEI